jgi:hypothetical protein
MRPSDRLLSSLVIAAVAIGTLAVPVSAAIGTSIYTSGRARIEQQHNTYQQWNGTVATTTSPDSVTDEVPVIPTAADTTVVSATRRVVTWTMNGISRTEPLMDHYGARTGDTVTVWTNDDGDQVEPPAETSIAAADGVTAAIALFGATVLAMRVLISAARTIIGWHNNRMWDLEWKNKFQQQA